jgi:hypothetical protein
LLAQIALLTALLVPLQAPPRGARITGRVIDATGAALPNARVVAESRSSRIAIVRDVTTDAVGSFVLDNIPPGSYLVRAERAGYVNDAPAGYARPVPLSINIDSGRTYPIMLRLVRTGSITGRIYDIDRRPVPRSEVLLLSARYGGFGQRILTRVIIQSPDGYPAIQTDEQGEYRVTGLPPGQYYVRAAYPSPATTNGRTATVRTSSAVATYYPGVSDPDQAVPIEVTPGLEVNAIDFTLTPLSPIKISGRIVNSMAQTTRGTYELYLVPRNARVREFLQQTPNYADRDGEFELRNVRPGTYEFYVAFRTGERPDQFRYFTGRSLLEVNDRDINAVTVSIEPGVDITGRIALDPAAQAVNPDLSRVLVLMAPLEGMPGILSPTAITGRSPIVQKDGTLTIRNAPRGRFMLVTSVNAGNLYVASAWLGTQEILGRPFEIDNDTTGPLVIEVSGNGGRIQGKVTMKDGSPVVGGQVVLVPPINFRDDQTAYKSATTEEQGRFAISGIRPGLYTAYALSHREDVGAWLNPLFIAPLLNSAIELSISAGQNMQQDFIVISEPK